MSDGPLLTAEEFTIKRPLFWAGVAVFFVGVVGGLVIDSLQADRLAFILDLITLTLVIGVIIAVLLCRLTQSKAVAVLIYTGALNFLFAIIQSFVAGPPTLEASLYNNLFILGLFLGLSTFLIGRTSSIIFGAVILAVLLSACIFWRDPSMAGKLWFEIPAVVGTSFLLHQYRGALDRILADLQRVIRENRTLRDRERLAALGEMTAGIAHEIKNPLNFVVNFAESSQELLMDLEAHFTLEAPTEKDREERSFLLKELKQNLEDIRNQGLRGASTVQAMLLQARSGTGDFQAVDLNELAGECLHLAGIGHRVHRARQRFVAWPLPVIVRGSRGDLSRAFLNLCTNAIWSVSERYRKDGPSFVPLVTVSVDVVGSEAWVTVADNGIGFSPQIQSQLFVPFFTTKPAGEGTGLGLSLTREVIVDQHGGRVEVEGNLETGARFVVILPLLGGEG